jgi:Delta24-sterol reductase
MSGRFEMRAPVSQSLTADAADASETRPVAAARSSVPRTKLRAKRPPSLSPLQLFLLKSSPYYFAFTALPLSFASDVVAAAWRRARSVLRTDEDGYESHVARVQAQVRRRNELFPDKKMATSRKPWATMSPRVSSNKRDKYQVHVGIEEVISVDWERLTIKLGPDVTMRQVSDFLLPRGYSLECHIEMEDLTIGGLATGFGIETANHRHGLFHESIVSFDIVMPNGELVHASRDEHVDVFRAIPWTWGTVGFITAVEVKMVKSTSHVHMRYIPCHSTKELRAVIEDHMVHDKARFLEAIVYDEHRSVVMAADFIEGDMPANVAVNPIGRWYKPWFYKHVETFLAKEGGGEEILPIRDFYHRHTKSIFWELETLMPYGNNPLFRFLFGWMGAPRIRYLKRLRSAKVREWEVYHHVIQESLVSIEHIEESVAKLHELFEVYPLLFYPFRLLDHGPASGMLACKRRYEGRDHGLYFDLAAYGIPRAVREGRAGYNLVDEILELERYTLEKGGFLTPYTDILLTREEYREMFDHTLYDRVRKHYGSDEAFPEVYDKIQPEFEVVTEG